MKSDHWFYRVFRECPWLSLRLLGLPEDRANEYQFHADDLKEVSLRLDGILRPTVPTDVSIFLEAQLYRDAEFYRKWMAKILLYSVQNRIEGDWCGLVLFGNRGHEPDLRHGIEEWIGSGRIRRVYLSELPEYPAVSLDVALLKLAVASRESLIEKASDLVTAAKASESVVRDPKKLLGLIEALVVSNFPRLTREEIRSMLQLHDISESTIFQEGKQEGLLEGKLKGKLEERMTMIARLHAKGRSVEEICDFLGVEMETVQEALASRRDT
jgi:predicted transposase/invertase (TIGR01784 family)